MFSLFKIYDVARKIQGHQVPLNAPVYTNCSQFNCQNLVYELEEFKTVGQSTKPNAFVKLMKSSSNRCNVKPMKNPRNAKERLLSDLISLLQSLNVNFTPMSVETLGKDLVSDPL